MVTEPAPTAWSAGREGAEERRPAWRTAALLALPLAVVAWRFWPITRNFFFGDDLLHYFQIVNLGNLHYLVVPYSGHSLFTRNLVSLALFRTFGPDPVPCFALAFATHLVNVGLVFAVIRAWTRSDRLASFGGLLWGASPINEHTLGWFAVYGQAIVTLAVLWILLDLVRIVRGRRLGRWMAVRWIALLLAASTSFGTGIGFAMTMPIAAFLLVPAPRARRRAVAWLALAALLVVVLYIGLAQLAAVLQGAKRPQFLAMAGGLRQVDRIAALTIELLAHGTQSLLPTLAPRFEFPNALSVSAVIAGLVLAAGGLIAGPGAIRRSIVALLLLVAGGYAIIALGRLPFTLRIDSAMITSAPRYHYAGPALIVIALCVALSGLRRFATSRVRAATFAAAVSLLVAGQVTFSRPIDNHDGYRATTRRALFDLNLALRSVPPGGEVRIENAPFYGVGPLLVGNPRTFPGLAALFTIFYADDVLEGRRVRFVEKNPRVLRIWRGRGPIGALLVPPDGQPALQIPR